VVPGVGPLVARELMFDLETMLVSKDCAGQVGKRPDCLLGHAFWHRHGGGQGSGSFLLDGGQLGALDEEGGVS